MAIKDRDVEERIDLWLHRPLAFLLLLPLRKSARWITPTHLTIVSMVLGVICGVLIFMSAERSAYWAAAGGVVMIASAVFDCADGMLARLRGGGTRFGQMLDAFADNISGLAFWFGTSYAMTYGWAEWWVWPANLMILISIVVHVALYDRFKVFYTSHVDDQQVKDVAHQPLDEGWLERTMSRSHETVYSGLFKLISGGGRSGAVLEKAAFRSAFRKPMRLVSFLGLGTHLFLMYVLVIISAWVPGYTFIAAQIIVVGFMNLLAVLAVVNWHRADRRAIAAIHADSVLGTDISL